KASYYFLRRAWQSLQITLTDEGLDGLHVHVVNETAMPFSGQVEIVLLKDRNAVVARRRVSCRLEPRTTRTFASDELLNGFYDVGYAYRVGPPKHDVVVATLFDETDQVVSEAFHFLHQREPEYLTRVALDVEAERVDA